MTEANTGHPGTIPLAGEWIVTEAAACHNFLLEQLPSSFEPGRDFTPIRIDLCEITGLDACGCQLLTLFLANLQRRGLSPQICGLRPELSAQIDLLGFGEQLGLTRPGKERHGD